MKLTWAQVRARRLARSRLTAPAASAVEAVRETCGIQAQLQSAAERGVALRVAAGVDVRAELWERRSLVRTWTLRGTLHLHPAEELGLWTAAKRALQPEEAPPGLLDAFADALDGRVLERAELADEVACRVGEWARGPIASGWAHLIGHAADAGILVHGPPRGSRVTFVRADQWLGETPHWDEADALREATRRFLRTYGPAGDLRTLGARGRSPADVLPGELVEVDVEGTRGWLPADDLELPEPEPSVFCLPQYDCYVLGFREREHLLWGAAKELYWDTRWLKRGRYESPVAFRNVLVDGAIAGTWDDDGVRLAEPLDAVHAALLDRARTLSP